MAVQACLTLLYIYIFYSILSLTYHGVQPPNIRGGVQASATNTA